MSNLYAWHEDEYIKSSYLENMPVDEISRILGRSPRQIYSRARFLGLKRDRHNAQKLANATKLKCGIIKHIKEENHEKVFNR